MGFIEFTKMAITSLKIGHFHPDFAQLRWPFLATVGLSGGGHCGGQLAWPPRISRPVVGVVSLIMILCLCWGSRRLVVVPHDSID